MWQGAGKAAVVFDHLFRRIGHDLDDIALILEIFQRLDDIRICAKLVVLSVDFLDFFIAQRDVVEIQCPAQAGLVETRMRHEFVAQGEMKHRPFMLEPPILCDVLCNMGFEHVLLDDIGYRVVVDQRSLGIEKQRFRH